MTQALHPIANAEDASVRLQAAFSRIRDERMQGIPILNQRLGVEAVGMRPTPEGWICALVTPWFLNLMLLPSGQAEQWKVSPPGSKSIHKFPAGAFEFIAGEEAGLGPYRMCSLFSPVLEFEDHAAARIAAEAALTALFDCRQADEDIDQEQQPTDKPQATAAPATSTTRRGLLFGRSATARGEKP